MQTTEVRIYDPKMSEEIIVKRYDDDTGLFEVTDTYNVVDDDPSLFFTEEAAVQLVEAIRKMKGETK